MSDWLPRAVDLLGYGAGALVLLAFSLRSLIALRAEAHSRAGARLTRRRLK